MTKIRLALNNLLLLILGFFVFSLPISKAGINIFSTLFVLLSIIKFILKKDEFFSINREYKNLMVFFWLFFLGVILNLLSPGGVESLKEYISKSMYFLMIPGILSILNRKTSEKYVKFFYISLLIGIMKSYFVFYKEFGGIYENWKRVGSFYDVGRWSAVLAFSLALMIPFLFNYQKKNLIMIKDIFINWILFINGVISLILSNARGPWITLTFVFFLYFVLYDLKKMKYIATIIIIFLLLFGRDRDSQLRERVRSIANTKDISNKGRLVMWREASIFIANNCSNSLILTGTGTDNYEDIYIEYLNKNNKIDVIAKETDQFSFSDNHNIYLNMINQMGIIYFLLYFYSIFKLFKETYIESRSEKNLYSKGFFLMGISFLVCGIFYGYIFSYEVYTFFFFLTILNIKFDNEKCGDKS